MTEKIDPQGTEPADTTSAATDLPDADLDDDGGDLFDALDSVIKQALDDVRLTPLQRLGLLKELAAVRKELQSNPTTMQRLKLAGRLSALRKELGATAPAPVVTPTPVDETEREKQADAIADGLAERTSTSHFYDFDPNRKQSERKKDNAVAMAILARIREGTLHAEALSDEEKQALAKYSGTGGNLVGADGKKGSAYEYYTPKPVAEGMWALLRESGFTGGRVLDPCGGVGIFGATSPTNAAVDSVELNETSGKVNQLVNDGPGYSTTIAPFERVAAATPDESYDCVVSNVPFGDKNDRGGNQFKDTRYRDEPIQNYFILRSLEKLKPGGLACFITPPRCVSGKGGKEEDLRIRASYMAEFVGAYRLPNKVFGTAAADTMTDVILFRKFRRPLLDKIAELREQNPKLLIEAGVLWQEFIKGTYFHGEGVKHILGTIAKAKGQFGEKDVLNSDLSISDIARLIRKFPKSRIQWELLDATETEPIVYREGDTVHHAGTTLQMQNGVLVVIKEAGDEEMAASIADSLAKLTTPLGAVNSDTTYADAVKLQQGMVDAARALEVPDWLRGLLAQLDKVPADQREAAWGAAIVGLGIDQAMGERQGEEIGFDYLTGYPQLSEAMKRVASDAKRPPTSLSSSIKTAMKKVGIFYSKTDGYSGVWRGDVVQSVDSRDAGTKFEAALYQAGGGTFVPLADARKVYGETFDPMKDDAWCVSRDGHGVAKADDYYVGNYGDFLSNIETEIATAKDDDIRNKLLRQKFVAESRIVKSDPSGMTFTLFSPFVTMEERAEFLRRFVDKDFVVGFDEKTGKPEIQFTGKIENGRDKLLKRFALYLSGTRLTLGGAEFGDEKAAIAELRRISETAAAQFNSWVKANPIIMGRLYDLANDPQRVYFRQTDDESPLEVPGLNPDWHSHGYQNAYVRQTGRNFSGINGYGVGLGKTSTSLIAVQHAQAIGTKKRTMFVVPNSVLSNWRKEVNRVYASTEDCLFVGLRFDNSGAPKADTKAYDADLTKILEGKHSKIFVTYEAFQRLRLKQSTAEAYDAYLASVDATYASSDNKADDEKGKSLRAQIIDQLTSDDAKSMAAPFFEDLGIDSIVMDEAHFCFPAGTLVDGKPIESLQVGDMVQSWNHDLLQFENKRISAVMKRPAPAMVRVMLGDGRSIACTPNHPFYVVGLGYVAAEFLAPGYHLATNNVGTQDGSEEDHQPDVMRAVRELISAVAGAGSQGRAIGSGHLLRSNLRIDSSVAVGRVVGATSAGHAVQPMRQDIHAGAHAAVEVPQWQGHGLLLQQVMQVGVGRSEQCHAAHFLGVRGQEGQDACRVGAQGQLAADAGSRGKEPQRARGTRHGRQQQAVGAGRQRSPSAYSSQDAGGCAVVEDRARHPHEAAAGQWLSDLLQGGPSASSGDARNRSGWRQSQDGRRQGQGCEENRVPGIVGVAGVALLEPGSDGRFGGVCSDGFVYDITVEGNHNFFAEGVLVHNCKNSSQAIDFKGGKFLSLAPPSARGIDAQAKCWYVRKDSPRQDGVILLTATPITNSPLEIYSMLSLAVGHAKLNNLMNGIKGADEFMATMCQLENRDEDTLDGMSKPYDVFVGLNNVGLLRNALAVTATIKDATDVGAQIVMPSGEEKATAVTLPKEAFDTLVLYKDAYRWAIDTLNEKSDPGGSQKAYDEVAAKFGEPMELIGHPFNLIQKMSLLIADPELDKRATFYIFSPAQADKVAEVVAKWNVKPPTEDRARPGPQTSPAAIVGEKTVKDGDDKITMLKIAVLARIDGQQVILDTLDSQNQAAFEALAEKDGIDFDVTVPPKLAALVENFQYEEANPRGVVGGEASGRVKQLIFCDTLALHTKIKRILTKKCGVAASAIAIITGKVNNKPEDILGVQEGFNAEGEDNKFRVVIANEKAEVGINLQKGTQAIHHLTLGWTPDSLTQRNGRGLRQGNETESVRVYQYDADGTFDCYKRTLVGAKSTWIDNVMSPDGGDNVAVTGGMSKREQEDMIDCIGDSNAMSRKQAEAQARDKIERAASVQGKQAVTLGTIKAQRVFLKKYEKVSAWAAEKIAAYINVRNQVGLIGGRIANPKATASAVMKNQNLLAELEARQAGLQRLIEASVTFTKDGEYDYRTQKTSPGSPATLNEFVSGIFSGYQSRDDKAKSISDRLYEIMTAGDGHHGFTWAVSEDGEIGNEWQSEIDMANNLIEASKQDFTRMAGQDGGHSTQVLDRALKGQTAIIDGKVVCTGAFVERNGELGVLMNVPRQGLQVHYLKDDADGKYVAAADELRTGTATLPGAPGYDALVTRAAEIEDAISAIGAMAERQALRLFSAVVPEVGQRRTKPVMVVYDTDVWFLPSPMFPRVVPAGDMIEAGAAVVARIANEQSSIVTSTVKPSYGSIDFVASSDAPLVKDKPGDWDTLLLAYCKAHGLKLSKADLNTLRLSPSNITNAEAADFKAAVVAGATSEMDLHAKRVAWMTNELLPAYDLAADPDFVRDPAAFLNRVDSNAAWEYQSAVRSIQRKLEDAARAAALAKLPAPTTVEPLPGVLAVDAPSPDSIVSVIGNTLKWKDQLKATASAAGKPARWNGRGGPVVNYKETGCWDVTAAIWRLFLTAYPAADQDLQLFKR